MINDDSKRHQKPHEGLIWEHGSIHNGSYVSMYMSQTGRSHSWMAKQDYIFTTHKIHKTTDWWLIDFIKSRDDDKILSWCIDTWGPSGKQSWWTLSRWIQEKELVGPLRLVVLGDERIMMWKMIWG